MCDADDLMLPGHMVRSTRALDRWPQVGVVYGDLRVTDSVENRCFIRHYSGLEKSWDLLREYLWHPGTLMRRSILLRAGGYNERLPFMFDYDLFLRLAEMTQFRHIAGKPLYIYRRHAGSISNRSQRQMKRIAQLILRKTVERRYGVRVPW
jgi:hypothetical protein